MKSAVQKDYFDLIQCWPLSIIEDEKQHDQAMEVMKQLALKNQMTEGECKYFRVLSLLVGQYEDKHFPLELFKV